MKTFRSNRSNLLDYAIAERGEALSSELSLSGVGARLEQRFDRADCKRRVAQKRKMQKERTRFDA